MSENTIKQFFPELFAQIAGDLNVLAKDKITIGQTKKIWWRCPLAKDHIWEATPAGRVYAYRKKGAKRPDGKTYGCPFCRGIKVARSNSLAVTHPQLTMEWSKNNVNITPEEVTAGSNKKVWWVCDKGHEWKAVIASRNSGRGCPYCYKNLRSTTSTPINRKEDYLEK